MCIPSIRALPTTRLSIRIGSAFALLATRCADQINIRLGQGKGETVRSLM